MGHKLTTKLEFSKIAGVSKAAITQACDSSIKAALVGARIDLNHPSAIAYLEKHTVNPISQATGLDPLYEKCVDYCRNGGRLSMRSFKAEFSIGSDRARKIISTIKATGILNQPCEQEVPEPEKPKPTKPKKPRGKYTVRKGATDVTVKDGDIYITDAPMREPEQPDPIPDDMKVYADMTLRDLVARFGTSTQFIDYLNAVQKIEAIEEKRLKNSQTRGELVNRELVKRGVIEHVDTMLNKMLSDGVRTISKRVLACGQSGGDIIEAEAIVTDQLQSFIKPMKARVNRGLKNV